MRAGRSHAYREAVLPGPEAGSGYRHVLLVGPTGAGKTSLVRQLLGTERDAFPAVSASKTTVAETEIIMAPGEFYAVVTFMSADETRLLIEESVLAAIASIADGRPDAAIQRSLAHHTDQRFHLRYILGPAASADEGDLGASEWLVDCLARLRRMVADVEPGTDRAEAVAAVDWRSDATFRRIVHRLLTDVRKRFAYVEGGEFQRDHDGWPHAWHFSTVDRGALLDGLSPFVANDGADFGRLLTPLVNGVRVRGPFHPTWAPEVPYLMLTDTEGMGHTPATASAMPEWMADAADRADRIVVVDSATQPAQAATAALLRGLAESGHTSKLSLCFTHLDLTRGPNLGTESARREFLRSCLDQVVAAADGDLGFVTRRALQRQLDEESFFVGRPDEAGHPDEADPWVGQYRRFLRALRAGSAPLDIEGPRPVYRREDLVAAVDAGVVEFRRLVLERAAGRRASSGGRRRWWQGLGGRFGARMTDDVDGFRPVAELARAVTVSLRAVAEQPPSWHGDGDSAVSPSDIIDHFVRNSHRRLRGLGRRYLVDDALLDWEAVLRSADLDADEIERIGVLVDRQLGLGKRWAGFRADALELVEAAAGEMGVLLVDGDARPDLTAHEHLPAPMLAARHDDGEGAEQVGTVLAELPLVASDRELDEALAEAIAEVGDTAAAGTRYDAGREAGADAGDADDTEAGDTDADDTDADDARADGAEGGASAGGEATAATTRPERTGRRSSGARSSRRRG